MISEDSLQKRTLFLITSSFPIGEFETFLESEFPFLQKAFDQIFIITNTPVTPDQRIPKEAAHVIYMPYLPRWYEKLRYPKYFFNSLIWSELKQLVVNEHRFPKLGMLSSMLGSLTTGNKLCRLIRNLLHEYQLNPNNTVAYSYWCNDMVTGLSLLKLYQPQIHCVTRAHGFDVYLERSTYNYLPLRRHIFNKLDSIYFASEHGKNYTVDKFGNYPSFKVARLGVNDGDREYHTKPDTLLRIVSCSSLIPLKQVDIIIDSLALIEDFSIHWTHIGSGELHQVLEEKASALLSSKKNIEFKFAGRIANEQVINYYREGRFDFFINTSCTEGLPVSMMEAMAHGIPVIGPDVGGVSELVVHLYNGYLISDQVDVQEVKVSLEKAAQLDQIDYQVYSTNAYQTWKHKYQAAINYSQFTQSLTSGGAF